MANNRWHTETRQFLAESDARILKQDAAAAAQKKAENSAAATEILRLCKASEAMIALRRSQGYER